MDCLFCKIIKGEIPCYKIYEDEYTLAFLDVSKDFDGHTLVIAKKHFDNILESDIETINHMMNTVKLISDHYANNCGYTGINLISNNGSSAEQGVKHFHIHIIPRITDNVSLFSEVKISKTSLEETQEKLKIN